MEGNPVNLLTVPQQGTDSATAKHFWFHDDDMGDNCHKVYWYFEDWIFG